MKEYSFFNDTMSSVELFKFPSSLKVFFIILYIFTSLLAVTGNLLVMYLVIFRRMRSVTNMFICNLALADVIIGMFAIPFQFQVSTYSILLRSLENPFTGNNITTMDSSPIYVQVLSFYFKSVGQCVSSYPGPYQYRQIQRNNKAPFP